MKMFICVCGIATFSLSITVGSADAWTLWKKADEAREFSFDAPWRQPDHWRAAREKQALDEIIRQYPGTLHEAQSRTRLAALHSSTWRCEHIREYQCLLAAEILDRLMKTEPGASGLAEAVGGVLRANRYDRLLGAEKFVERANAHLRKRFELGGADAAEAGFFWSQFGSASNDRRQIARKIVTDFPDSKWALPAELVSILDDRDKLLAFADRNRGHYLAGLALTVVGNGIGNVKEKDPNPLPRWTQAMEVYLRHARQCSPRKDWREAEYFEMYTWIPSFYASFDTKCQGPPDKLDQMAAEFYALRPSSSPHPIEWTLTRTRGLPPSTYVRPEERVEFFVKFWGDVERRTARERMPEHLLHRARFFLSWSMIGLGNSKETPEARARKKAMEVATVEFNKHSTRLLTDHPRSRFAPLALDLLAIHALIQSRHDKCREYWQQLLTTYPDCPLVRLVTFDLAALNSTQGRPWRKDVENLKLRFPDDPVLAVMVPVALGRAYESEHRIQEVLAQYEAALQAFGSFPKGEVRLGAMVGPPLSSELQRTGFKPVSRETLDKKVAEWQLHVESKFEDLVLWQWAENMHGDERIAALRELVRQFSESRLSGRARVALAMEYESRADRPSARRVYASVANDEHASPADKLLARLAKARMDYGVPDKHLEGDKLHRAKRLMERLGADQFQEREAAEQSLLSMGTDVLYLLQDAAKGADKEIAARAKRLLNDIPLHETRTALEVCRKAIAGRAFADPLKRDLVDIHEDAWWQLSADPRIKAQTKVGLWWLVNGTIDVLQVDGSHRQVEIEHTFAHRERAMTLSSADIELLIKLVQLETPGKEHDYANGVIRNLISIGQPEYVPARRPRHFHPTVYISRIRFLNAERTRAKVEFTFEASGSSFHYEKKDGKWIYLGPGSQWIG